MHLRFTENDNFNWLAAALVLILAGTAVADGLEFHFGQLLVQASIVTILAVGVWSVGGTPRWYFKPIGMLLTIVPVTLAMVFIEVAALHIIWLTIMLLYLVATAWVAMKQVLFTGTIDGNKIVGSVCIYLLVGLIWTTAYLMVAQQNPEAFKNLDPGAWYERFPDFVYFSFVTLTTLGYGDISPEDPIARFLAIMEAIFGQFYIAILVASLVGARMSSEPAPEKD